MYGSFKDIKTSLPNLYRRSSLIITIPGVCITRLAMVMELVVLRVTTDKDLVSMIQFHEPRLSIQP
jgi:hypothetical protein